MISPDVEVVDLAGEPWALVQEAYQAARARRWGYVLHEGGAVVKTHGPLVDPPSPGDRVAEPAALARELRSRSDVERVVVIDRAGLADLVRAATGKADPSLSLQEFRAAVADAYWQSPAVATDPAPPRDPWPDIHDALAKIGHQIDGLIVLDGIGAAGASLAVRFELEDGVVVRVTGFDGAGPGELEERMRAATLFLRADWDRFRQAITSYDALDAMADVVESATAQRGLDDAPALLRRAGRP
jgi:hypothetical protein